MDTSKTNEQLGIRFKLKVDIICLSGGSEMISVICERQYRL